jgi:predicted helicase
MRGPAIVSNGNKQTNLLLTQLHQSSLQIKKQFALIQFSDELFTSYQLLFHNNPKSEDLMDFFAQGIPFVYFFHHILITENKKDAWDQLNRILSHPDIRALWDVLQDQNGNFSPNLASITMFSVTFESISLSALYETFLSLWSKTERQARGAFYTPSPLIRYILQGIHEILQTHFQMTLGISDPRVSLIDPSAGCLNFLRELLLMSNQFFPIDWASKSTMMYDLNATALFLGLLDILYLQLKINQKINVLPKLIQNNFLSKPVLSIPHSSVPIILGNPPYCGLSTNTDPGILQLIHDYFRCNGQPLAEKNPKWLQDDYVKFIRKAEADIVQHGNGIIAFVTNHAFLDNPTFRGMRAHLLHSFSEIYVLNLHGNRKKHERCPDGSKDENVFKIQQGVTIVFFILKPDISHRHLSSNLFYAELWGAKNDKLTWLQTHEFARTPWVALIPSSPLYLFIPIPESSDTPLSTVYPTNYMDFVPLHDIFYMNSPGIVTANDGFTIRPTPNEMWDHIQTIFQMSESEIRQKFSIHNAQDWQLEKALNDLHRDHQPDPSKVVPIHYRPFDRRYTYFTGKSAGFIGRPRTALMQTMLQIPGNYAFIAQKRKEFPKDYAHFFVVGEIAEHGLLSPKETCYIFPRFLLSDDGHATIRSNIRSEFRDRLSLLFQSGITDDEIFDFVYGLGCSAKFRRKYEFWLSQDFPRIPFPTTKIEFDRVAAIGQKLRGLHLFKTDPPGYYSIDQIDSIIENTPKELQFTIGGYRVLEYWLKKEKKSGRNQGDRVHFLRILNIIAETLSLQEQLDRGLK